MCPPGRNTLQFSPTFGEFVMPTPGGHMGPPLRAYHNIVLKRILPELM